MRIVLRHGGVLALLGQLIIAEINIVPLSTINCPETPCPWFMYCRDDGTCQPCSKRVLHGNQRPADGCVTSKYQQDRLGSAIYRHTINQPNVLPVCNHSLLKPIGIQANCSNTYYVGERYLVGVGAICSLACSEGYELSSDTTFVSTVECHNCSYDELSEQPCMWNDTIPERMCAAVRNLLPGSGQENLLWIVPTGICLLVAVGVGLFLGWYCTKPHRLSQDHICDTADQPLIGNSVQHPTPPSTPGTDTGVQVSVDSGYLPSNDLSSKSSPTIINININAGDIQSVVLNEKTQSAVRALGDLANLDLGAITPCLRNTVMESLTSAAGDSGDSGDRGAGANICTDSVLQHSTTDITAPSCPHEVIIAGSLPELAVPASIQRNDSTEVSVDEQLLAMLLELDGIVSASQPVDSETGKTFPLGCGINSPSQYSGVQEGGADGIVAHDPSSALKTEAGDQALRVVNDSGIGTLTSAASHRIPRSFRAECVFPSENCSPVDSCIQPSSNTTEEMKQLKGVTALSTTPPPIVGVVSPLKHAGSIPLGNRCASDGSSDCNASVLKPTNGQSSMPGSGRKLRHSSSPSITAASSAECLDLDISDTLRSLESDSKRVSDTRLWSAAEPQPLTATPERNAASFGSALLDGKPLPLRGPELPDNRLDKAFGDAGNSVKFSLWDSPSNGRASDHALCAQSHDYQSEELFSRDSKPQRQRIPPSCKEEITPLTLCEHKWKNGHTKPTYQRQHSNGPPANSGPANSGGVRIKARNINEFNTNHTRTITGSCAEEIDLLQKNHVQYVDYDVDCDSIHRVHSNNLEQIILRPSPYS